jgi:signal transduction histidine kinase
MTNNNSDNSFPPRYQPASLPDNELNRLIALERFQILDTLPDPAIDDLSTIAAQICGTPIGLVSLVDSDRQWFKAKCGIDATETSRDVSFCAHAILKPDDVFVVSDTLKDDRFADNPLVTGEPHIRFYAGTPLVTDDGYALGSLCVIDRKPRQLSEAQLDALAALGRQVIDQFNAHRTLRRLQQSIVQLHATQLSAVQNAKMSALGHLVSGIAHEINNPIGFIGSNLPHVRDYTEELLTALALYRQACPEPPVEIAEQLGEIEIDYVNDDLPKILSSMQGGVNRVVEIVRSLKTFVRSDEAEIKAIDLNTNLDRILVLFNEKFAATPNRSAIELSCNYGDLPPLMCYPAQVNQVFLNLLTNAIDAIDAKAITTIDYSGHISVNTRVDDDRIRLEIADDGIGIAPEHARHIFDPFFTTKDVGRGSGLGLASCYAIITEQHQGSIAYRQRPEGGSLFEVVLPIANPHLRTLIQHN